MDRKTFRKMRVRWRLRQYEVARKARIMPATLSAWELGQRNLSQLLVLRAEHALQEMIKEQATQVAQLAAEGQPA